MSRAPGTGNSSRSSSFIAGAACRSLTAPFFCLYNFRAKGSTEFEQSRLRRVFARLHSSDEWRPARNLSLLYHWPSSGQQGHRRIEPGGHPILLLTNAIHHLPVLRVVGHTHKIYAVAGGPLVGLSRDLAARTATSRAFERGGIWIPLIGKIAPPAMPPGYPGQNRERRARLTPKSPASVRLTGLWGQTLNAWGHMWRVRPDSNQCAVWYVCRRATNI